MSSLRRTITSLALLAILMLVVGGLVVGWGAWRQYDTQRQLDQIQALLKENRAADAEDQLVLLEDQVRPGRSWAPLWVDLRFQALEGLEDHSEIAELAQRALDSAHPLVVTGDAGWVRAHSLLGLQRLRERDLNGARLHYEALGGRPAGTPGHAEGELGLARIELATPGQVPAGRDRLLRLIGTLPEAHPARSDVETELGRANLFLLMSREPAEGDQLYTIQRGDSLDRLRRKFQVSADLLQRVNGISNPRNMTVGQRIKIPNLDLAIHVDKTANTLTLTNHGQFFKKYRVRTGEFDYMTPVGEYRIARKVVDPQWSDPKSGRRYGPGEAGNELGCRWMEFSGSLGIHEAIDPATIGTYSSNGCVGLVREDVIELYDLVNVGTPIKIVGERVPQTALTPAALGR